VKLLRLASLIPALALAACTWTMHVRVSGSDPQHPVFSAHGSGPFGLSRSCVEHVSVSEERGEGWTVKWDIESETGCRELSRIEYGKVPSGFYAVVDAIDLVPNRLHHVGIRGEGSSGGATFKWTSTGHHALRPRPQGCGIPACFR
jgi:hypothetical protein